MGDISELRVLVVVGVILASFVFIVGLIPSEFVAGVAAGTAPALPTSFDAYNLLGWNETADINILYGTDAIAAINGFNIRVQGLTTPSKALYIETYASFYGYFDWEFDQFTWYQNGTQVSVQPFPYSMQMLLGTIDEQYNSNGSLSYDIRNSHTSFQVMVVWDQSIYHNTTAASSAYTADDLHLVFNAKFDSMGSQLNGWSLVSRLMLFSLPDVPQWIQYLISVPIWIGLAYVAFIFVLRMIGAVFGGGGA